MSTAQTLRDAAVSGDMERVHWGALSLFLEAFEWNASKADTGGIQHCTFMLIVACALDGGEREPMGSKERIPILDQFYDDHLSMAEFIKLVERHHGIGINK